MRFLPKRRAAISRKGDRYQRTRDTSVGLRRGPLFPHSATLHADVRSLYPDFTPYVAKYGDNGRAFNVSQLRDYFGAYRREYGALASLDTMRLNSTQVLRQKITSVIGVNPAMFTAARRIYRRVKYGG